MCKIIFEIEDNEILEGLKDGDIARFIIDFENKESEFVIYPSNENVSNFPYEANDFEDTLDLFNDYKTDNGGGSPIYIVDIVCNNIIGDDVIDEDVKEKIKSLLQSTNSNIENCTCYKNLLHIQFQHFNYIFTYDNPELFFYDDPVDEEEKNILLSKLDEIESKYNLTKSEKELIENFRMMLTQY